MKNPSPTVSMADKVALIDSLCAKARILPVITIAREQDVLPLADALAAGGLTALEVTLRSRVRPQGHSGPARAASGAVYRCRHRARSAYARKRPKRRARNLSSPPALPATCWKPRVDSPIPLLPGISNASGIMEGYSLGYRRFKLFPAEVSGGVAAIKALGGPFGEVKFCPTGGVGPANIKSYMALKNVMCVGGSWMLDPEWIKNGDWARIQEVTAEALALLD